MRKRPAAVCSSASQLGREHIAHIAAFAAVRQTRCLPNGLIPRALAHYADAIITGWRWKFPLAFFPCTQPVSCEYGRCVIRAGGDWCHRWVCRIEIHLLSLPFVCTTKLWLGWPSKWAKTAFWCLPYACFALSLNRSNNSAACLRPAHSLCGAKLAKSERASAHTAVRWSICLCKLAMHIYTQPESKREELDGWGEEDVAGNQRPLHAARSTSAVLQFSRKADALKAS